MRRTLAAPTTVDAMGISHIALAVKDLDATHRFYTDVMGFDLVKVEIADMRGGKAQSVYAEDPDGNVVEFAIVTEGFTEADAAEALELLTADDPPMSPPPTITFHPAAE